MYAQEASAGSRESLQQLQVSEYFAVSRKTVQRMRSVPMIPAVFGKLMFASKHLHFPVPCLAVASLSAKCQKARPPFINIHIGYCNFFFLIRK
jgi:hypothetical protein